MEKWGDSGRYRWKVENWLANKLPLLLVLHGKSRDGEKRDRDRHWKHFAVFSGLIRIEKGLV